MSGELVAAVLDAIAVDEIGDGASTDSVLEQPSVAAALIAAIHPKRTARVYPHDASRRIDEISCGVTDP